MGAPAAFTGTEGNAGVGWADNAVPPLKGGSGLGIPSPPAIVLPPDGELVVPTIGDAERLQGFPRGWTQPASQVDHRGERIRWLMIGNAVSVPVAQWIGERLREVHRPLEREDQPIPAGSKWPAAAWQVDPSGPRFARRGRRMARADGAYVLTFCPERGGINSSSALHQGCIRVPSSVRGKQPAQARP